MRRAFIKFFRAYARHVWGYAPDLAADMADRSTRTEDHYFAIFRAGWNARKAAERE